MQKWEYHVDLVMAHRMGKVLREMGVAGWELVSCEITRAPGIDDRSGMSAEYCVAFKRPIAEHGVSGIGQVMPESVSELHNAPASSYVRFHFERKRLGPGRPLIFEHTISLGDTIPDSTAQLDVLLACLSACSIAQAQIRRLLRTEA